MTVIGGSQSPPTEPTLDQAPPYARLHVTPLDADLLKVILSSALLPKARNISYHTLETFPEKRYGYLELPTEDADKLKKKLNGATLRGVKIRIERAKPSRIPAPLGDEAMAKEKKDKRVKDGARTEKDKSKKRKRDKDEISGIILDNDRKVKRGWTTADEPKEKRSKKDKKDSKDKKKKQERSKYTDHAECLVKTVLPANAVPSAEDDTRSKRKKKGKSREVVVHEFEKTTKFPTFLKTTVSSGPSKTPLEFAEGKGWVDEDGNVVEAVAVTMPPPAFKISAPTKPEPSESNSESSSGDSSGGDESGSDSESDSLSSPTKVASTPNNRAPPRPSPTPQQNTSPIPSTLSPELLRPKSSGSAKNLAIKIPPATPNEPKIIHPLEALYKRSQQTDGETAEGAIESKGFSFFGGGDVDNDNEDAGAAADGLQIPMTPFTRQDFEIRGIRSAAPTPDTAHPTGGRFKPWDDHDEDMEDEDDREDHLPESNEQPSASRVQAGVAEGDKPASDFQKWFWENRGDLNRSWKKRRKTAGKEKRYRENRARMARAI
ncbi:hypothetical protein QBC41DRAFT_329589 [Cercophora samala]|uniref:Uncharacterized protein n=1 Tax=Cercophora samala TaxID=330535 RepID=A0AA39Z1W4_9PEZI|nr:hypothetical protein QBC41DRAFT_329589 [Cercophora samala]